MIVTEYKNVSNVSSAKVKDYSWKEFCNKIKHPAVSVGTTWGAFLQLPKDFTREKGKVVDYDEETQFSIKTKAGGAVFGEMILPDGMEKGRKKEYFPKRSAIVFDYENCSPDIYDRIKESLKDFTYCYHSTCKHRPPEDVRLHVIIPFLEPVDFKSYYILAVILANKIGLQGLDVSSLRRSQMELYCVCLRGNEYIYNVHNVEKDGEVKFLNGESYLLENYGTTDVNDLTTKLEIDWRKYEINEMKYLTGEMRSKKFIAFKPVVCNFEPSKPVAGDVKSCFNSVFSVREIFDDELREFYEPCGDRYTYYKGSSSGGVWISDDGTRCGSYHADSGDPLYGRGVTAFDLFLIYKGENCKSYREKIKLAHDYAKNKKGNKYEKLYYGVNKIW